VTSNDEQDDASYLTDVGTYTDQTFDDDDDCYDYYDGDNRRKKDLVFHGLAEGLHGMTDPELIAWVLEDGLELDSRQYIEDDEIERFGRNQVPPIRVKIQTIEKRREILRLAKTLRWTHDFRRIYIQPFLSRRQQQIAKELREVLREYRNKGYRNVRIVRSKIVQHLNGNDVVLYESK